MAQPVELTEKLLRREDKYKGILMDVHVDTVELPNGVRPCGKWRITRMAWPFCLWTRGTMCWL